MAGSYNPLGSEVTEPWRNSIDDRGQGQGPV